jgi:hypothetical protein
MGPRGLRFAASAAALELDNISLAKKQKTEAIGELASMLAEGIPPENASPIEKMTDTVMVICHWVQDGGINSTIDEAIGMLDTFVRLLREVASYPAESEKAAVEYLRDECLRLGRTAARLNPPKMRRVP